MYDVVSEAFHRGVPGGARPWSREPAVRILCPSPGYDRHFALCEYLGADTVAVAIGDQGPGPRGSVAAGRRRSGGQGDLLRAALQQPDRDHLRRRHRARARAHEDRGAGLPHHLGQRLRGPPSLPRPRAARRHRRGVPRRGSSRPPAPLHLDLEDHVRRRRHVRHRRQRRQHELVPRLAHEAHDRPRQDHAASPCPLPTRSRRPRRAHGEARRDPAARSSRRWTRSSSASSAPPASRRGADRAAATSSASTCRTAAPPAWWSAPRRPASSSPAPAPPSRAARIHATATSGSRRASRRSPSCGRRPRSWRCPCSWSRPKTVRVLSDVAASATAR